MVEPFLYYSVQLWFPLGRRCSKSREDKKRAEGQDQRNRPSTALECVKELLWIDHEGQLSPTELGTEPLSGNGRGTEGWKGENSWVQIRAV